MAESNCLDEPARVLSINVGGVMYSTIFKTIENFPNSRLALLVDDHRKTTTKKDDSLFIDRDGVLFRYILNYLRSSELKLPLSFDEHEQLISEAEFYGLPDLRNAVEKAYLKKRKKNECVLVSVCYYYKKSFRPLDMTSIFFNSKLKDDLQGPCALVQGKAEVLKEMLEEFSQDLPIDLDDSVENFLSHVLYRQQTKYFTHVFVPLGHFGVEDKEMELGSATSPGIVWSNKTVNRVRAFSEIMHFDVRSEEGSQLVHYQGDSRSGAGWKQRMCQLDELNRLCLASLVDIFYEHGFSLVETLNGPNTCNVQTLVFTR